MNAGVNILKWLTDTVGLSAFTMPPVVGLVVLIAGLLFHYGVSTKHKVELLDRSLNLTNDELRLMQEMDNSIDDASRIYPQQVATEIFESKAPEERERLNDRYNLYKRVAELSQETYWENYRHFVGRSLNGLANLFGESGASAGSAHSSAPASVSVPVSTLAPMQPYFSFQSYVVLLFMALVYPLGFALLSAPFSGKVSLAGVDVAVFSSSWMAAVFVLLSGITLWFSFSCLRSLASWMVFCVS